jgi:peptide deformylase
VGAVKARKLLWLMLLTLLPACAGTGFREYPMAIEVPQGEMPVVQQTKDAAARARNALYLPARRIMSDEFASPELTELIGKMRDVMHATGGIGIAANQLGKRLQVFMIEAKPTNPRYRGLGEVPFEVFINPRILRASAERRNFWHGCLSAVGEPRGNLATYEWIEVEAAGEDGKVRREKLAGLAAVIFQHELRHLLGGTYLDKARELLPKEELDALLDRKERPFFERAGPGVPLLLDDYRVGETLEEFYGRRASP